ncbi:hypothetical protein LPC08_12045 [Roseomonas sp. OT10]|uniref:hypothetical protein n=1 Tax=Roseomonas cutis TaxID=2897332 RepID=UPI001E302EBF|nr:hypothetical protein [Roseomonas sp. OT10]UFN51275.1 hypothetical protein LPC08_12045 [Roseomonas sp. OT10]
MADGEICYDSRHISLDDLVRRRLQQWPQRPPGAATTFKQPGTWLRGRPGDPATAGQPFLKLPGASRLRTLPDGLWLHVSPDPADPYVDILCIEACSSLQNLLDKRSRFAPSTTSLLVVCPVGWLLAPVQPGDPTPRWKLMRLLRQEPTENLTLPVRDVRVLFGLKSRHYEGFALHQTPQAHEYFCPMDALTAEDGQHNPAMQALIARASASANFMHLPHSGPGKAKPPVDHAAIVASPLLVAHALAAPAAADPAAPPACPALPLPAIPQRGARLPPATA